MKKEDWAQFDELYQQYEAARKDYEDAQMNLRGAFSEMTRHYEQGTLNEARLFTEEKAHEAFSKAREKLHLFLKEKLKKD